MEQEDHVLEIMNSSAESVYALSPGTHPNQVSRPGFPPVMAFPEYCGICVDVFQAGKGHGLKINPAGK